MREIEVRETWVLSYSKTEANGLDSSPYFRPLEGGTLCESVFRDTTVSFWSALGLCC